MQQEAQAVSAEPAERGHVGGEGLAAAAKRGVYSEPRGQLRAEYSEEEKSTRTDFFILRHRLVVLPAQLGPSREVVLGADVAQFLFEPQDFTPQSCLLLCGAGGADGQLVIEDP